MTRRLEKSGSDGIPLHEYLFRTKCVQVQIILKKKSRDHGGIDFKRDFAIKFSQRQHDGDEHAELWKHGIPFQQQQQQQLRHGDSFWSRSIVRIPNKFRQLESFCESSEQIFQDVCNVCLGSWLLLVLLHQFLHLAASLCLHQIVVQWVRQTELSLRDGINFDKLLDFRRRKLAGNSNSKSNE